MIAVGAFVARLREHGLRLRRNGPRVLVFLKAPRVGAVKTRLAREVGAEEATRIYRRLVERQLASIPPGWPAEIRFTPDDAGPEMRGWLGTTCDLRPQGEGDPGARLARAFDAAFRRGARAVLAIGGDCPGLDAATLEEASRRLLRTDLVLGPALDGGYTLIGLRRPVPRMFEGIPWSTGAVWSTTLERAAETGLACEFLDPGEDIDDLASWRRFEERQRNGSSTTVPLAIVMPALNEAARIRESVLSAKSRLPDAPVIVVDGGSTDGTASAAASAGAAVVASAPGRGVQCRAGADATRAAWLLFLHADTLLPVNAAEAIGRFVADPAAMVATFRLRFDDGGWFLRGCGWFTRFDSVFTRFGDQGILIRRSFHDALGGFPAWPLFEDVALLQRARRVTKIHSLAAPVTTSARRFQRRGTYRQQWLNARLLLRYLCGARPETLAAIYRNDPAEQKAARTPARGVAPASDAPAAVRPRARAELVHCDAARTGSTIRLSRAKQG